MKKDRNHFFESSNYQMSAMGNMPMMNAASSNFYASQNMPMQMPMPMNNQYTDNYDARLAKIERNIQRLEARINKLEAGNFNNSFDNDNNMYMV